MGTMLDVTGSQNSNMAAEKPEVLIYLRLEFWLRFISTLLSIYSSTGKLDPENVRVAVGISFLSHIRAEI